MTFNANKLASGRSSKFFVKKKIIFLENKSEKQKMSCEWPRNLFSEDQGRCLFCDKSISSHKSEFEVFMLQFGKCDIQAKDKHGYWYHAKIVDTNRNGMSQVKVHFYDYEDKFDEWINVDENHMKCYTPYSTLTEEHQVFLKNLKVGSQVDVLFSHAWINAKITEIIKTSNSDL